MRIRQGKGDPRSILVTRLRFLGDVILSLSAVAALRRAYPGASIDYLCESPYDQVLHELPDLRRVHVLRRGDLGRGKTFFELLRAIRGEYDLVVDLFSNPRSAWLCGLSGAPSRVGRGSWPRSLAYNIRPREGEPDDSALRHHLRSVEPVTGRQDLTLPRLRAPEQDLLEGRRMLEDRGLGQGAVAILAGATHASKEWPAEYFVRLAAQLRIEGRWRPFFLGQPGKRDLLQRIRALSNSQVVIFPELELRSLMGLLAASRGLVCADGGVMHLAIALGTPTLALFGPTDPGIWFPYGEAPHAELLIDEAHCRPCHKHHCDDPFCLEGIAPERAFERFGALLDRTEPA